MNLETLYVILRRICNVDAAGTIVNRHLSVFYNQYDAINFILSREHDNQQRERH